MNTRTGDIVDFLPEVLRPAEPVQRDTRPPVKTDIWVSLTPAQAAFFKTKGLAFRQLWGKRIARGLYRNERERLDAMIAETKAKP